MDEIKEFLEDKLNEECGVFGIYNSSSSSSLIYYGLHALQHRGQEGCGIVVSNGNELKRIKGEGLVQDVFNNEKISSLQGIHGIGHIRYSTAGGGGIENVQPFFFRHHRGDFALAHNGNIVNSKELKTMLENRGSIFQSTSDSEILAHLIRKDGSQTRIETIIDACRMIEGGFAFVLLTKDKLYAFRDKHGLRPLSIGLIGENTYVVSSETCAFEVIGAKFIRDLEPGEIVTISSKGIESTRYSEYKRHCMCAMEYIYFARPDSDIEGVNVHAARKESGRLLARQSPVDADIVIGVPDSSISAAIGYSEESKIPYEMGLIKNKYVGRTFIQPTQEMRERGVRMKLSTVPSIVKGKRIVLIDDSIVRGTTSRKIVTLLKEAGAKEIHVRIASPAITHPCFYGVDTSTYEELISVRLDVDGVRNEIGADSLAFLNIENLYKMTARCELCTACFNGKYPTNIYQSLKDANKEGKF